MTDHWSLHCVGVACKELAQGVGFGAGQLLLRQTTMPNGRRDIRALNLMLEYCKPRDE